MPDLKGSAIKPELFKQVTSFKVQGVYLGFDGLSDMARKPGVARDNAEIVVRVDGTGLYQAVVQQVIDLMASASWEILRNM